MTWHPYVITIHPNLLLQKPTSSYLHIDARSDTGVRAHQRSLFRRAYQWRDPSHWSRGCHLQREDTWSCVVDNAFVRRYVHIRIIKWRDLRIFSAVFCRRQKRTSTACDIAHRCPTFNTSSFPYFHGKALANNVSCFQIKICKRASYVWENAILFCSYYYVNNNIPDFPKKFIWVLRLISIASL